MPSAYTLTGRPPELTDAAPPAASGDDGGEDIGSYHTTVCAAAFSGVAVSSSGFFIGSARSCGRGKITTRRRERKKVTVFRAWKAVAPTIHGRPLLFTEQSNIVSAVRCWWYAEFLICYA
jgi:hypothetical protein